MWQELYIKHLCNSLHLNERNSLDTWWTFLTFKGEGGRQAERNGKGEGGGDRG